MKNLAFFFACVAVCYMVAGHGAEGLVSILLAHFCRLTSKDGANK